MSTNEDKICGAKGCHKRTDNPPSFQIETPAGLAQLTLCDEHRDMIRKAQKERELNDSSNGED